MFRLLLVSLGLCFISIFAGCIGEPPSSDGALCRDDLDCDDNTRCIRFVCGGPKTDAGGKENAFLPEQEAPKTEKTIDNTEPSEENVDFDEKIDPDRQRPDGNTSSDGGESGNESGPEGENTTDRVIGPEDFFESGPDAQCFPGQSRDCYPGKPNTRGKGLCKDGRQFCLKPGRWGACQGATTPTTELCDNQDNDCDGLVDEGLGVISCGQGACFQSISLCKNGQIQSCVPKTPGSQELCGDGIDNDCDGLFDEGCKYCLPSRPEKILENGHNAEVLSVALTLDGAILASAGNGSKIFLWEVSTGKLLQVLEGHQGAVTSLAFNFDGSILASGSTDKTIRLWAWKNKTVRTLNRHSDTVTSVAFSPDGKTFASGSKDQDVKLWVPSSGAFLGSLPKHNGTVTSISFNATSQILATASTDGKVQLWNVNTGQSLRVLTGHKGAVNSVSFHPVKPLLLSGGADKIIRVWEINKSSPIKTYTGHTKEVRAVVFGLDEVISAGDDLNIFVREYATGRARYLIQKHTRTVRSLAISNKGPIFLASGSDDSSVRLWEVRSGVALQNFAGHEDAVYHSIFSKDGKKLASASKDGSVKLWSFPEGHPTVLTPKHRNEVNKVAFSSDGKRLASVSSDRTARLWSTVDGQWIATFSGHSSGVYSVALSSNGKYLATGSADQTIRIWDIAAIKPKTTVKKPLFVLTGHQDTIYDLNFHPNNSMLASASADGTAILWDLISKKPTILKGHQDTVYSVAFSPNGSQLASGSSDRTIKLWNVSSPTSKPVTLTGHTAPILYVSYSSNGNLLASSSEDKTIKIWELSPGYRARTLTGHSDNIYSVAFRSDNRMLVSSSQDGSIRFWSCPCTPKSTKPCYQGPMGTASKGNCKNGKRTCSAQGVWGACYQQVLPTPELPDGKDNNCDGKIDDGYTDLQIHSLSVSQISVQVGGLVRVTVCSTNRGKGSTDPFKIRLYFSVDSKDIPVRAQALTGSAKLPSDISYSALKAGLSPNCQNRQIEIPRTLVGQRTIGAVIDFENKIVETNEANNLNTVPVTVVP